LFKIIPEVLLMSQTANETEIDRPPVVADPGLPSRGGEFNFSIGQTLSLLAATYVLYCFSLPWLVLGVEEEVSGYGVVWRVIYYAVAGENKPPIALAVLVIVLLCAVAVIFVLFGKERFGGNARKRSILITVMGVVGGVLMLYHYFNYQSGIKIGGVATLFGIALMTGGGLFDLLSIMSGGGIRRINIPVTLLRAYTILFALIAIWVYFHFWTHGLFLSSRNMSILFQQMAVTGVLAVGMLMVIVAGQIDLSVGSVVGLTGGVVAMLLVWQEWGLIPALLAAILLGIAIGALHGALIAYMNIPAFIVTLGGLLAWRGAIKGISDGSTVRVNIAAFKAIGGNYVGPFIGNIIAAVAVAFIVWMTLRRNRARVRHGQPAASLLSTVLRITLSGAVVVGFIMVMNAYELAPGVYAGLPISVLIFLAVALLGAFLTQNTTFGRYLFAIGGNPDAARLSGISIRKHILMVFCVMGALTGVAAIIFTSRVGSGAPDAGVLLELDAIAACVIGGTSLMGGRGTVFGACLGALIMASLDNGMGLLGVQDYKKDIIKGAILVAAVGLDMLGRKRG
jgi:D-xylose transport system permease protein